jgi:SAM-dependent methyltransferase
VLWFLKRRLNNQYARDDFVRRSLAVIPAGSMILDAGAGPQPYRSDCAHLQYRAQDSGDYPGLHYRGDIWDIDEEAAVFDAILCSEVLEHIPYPAEALVEFGRLLKPRGLLILTAPSNCLRHMDPQFFYSGFSDRWFQKFLPEAGLKIETLEAVGDFYSWLAVEVNRTADMNSVLARAVLLPAFAYYLLKRKTPSSAALLCMGYHVVARKQYP